MALNLKSEFDDREKLSESLAQLSEAIKKIKANQNK